MGRVGLVYCKLKIRKSNSIYMTKIWTRLQTMLRRHCSDFRIPYSEFINMRVNNMWIENDALQNEKHKTNDKYIYLGTVHKGRPPSGGLSSADMGDFRCGRPHFLMQSLDFSKFMVCLHGQGGGVNFSRFCAGVLYGQSLTSHNTINLKLLFIRLTF